MEYRKYNSYPHMRPEDQAIWDRFITKNPEAYNEVFYDVPVGEGAQIPKGTQENIAIDFKILTQWKIDVVGHKGNNTDIIELKPNAGIGALGQIQSYARLYKKIAKPIEQITPVLITDKLRPDMELLAREQGIILIIV